MNDHEKYIFKCIVPIFLIFFFSLIIAIHSILKKYNTIPNYNTEELTKLSKQVEEKMLIIEILKNYTGKEVIVTSYSPSVDETDNSPYITASGDMVHSNYIAVSRDLYHKGWKFGRQVYIKDMDKIFTIKDVMNKRFTNRIDVFHWKKKDAKEFGIQKHKVYLIER